LAEFTWAFDAPTGTYKQSALSQQLYYSALERTVFMEHVSTVEGYGRKMGENVTLTRVRTVTEPTSATLTEGVRIPEDTFRLSTRTITPGEIGRSIPFTSLAEDFSRYDIENNIQRRLRDQMELVLDTMASTAFKTAQIKYTPRGAASGNFDTGGTVTTSALANWGVYHCERVRDYMFDTLQAPGYDGGSEYVGIFRALAIRGLKSDPDWEQWHVYTDPQAKFNSEVGKIEQIRHIETNHNTALSTAQGTGGVLGEGVVFGDDAVALAEVLTPELRAQTNVGQDFGRMNAVAWYGILAFASIWDTANAGEARIIHVTST
jgi:N4-gp56 family major capsid protein